MGLKALLAGLVFAHMDLLGPGYVAALLGSELVLWRLERARQLRRTGADPDVLWPLGRCHRPIATSDASGS